jgi:hypothetical protein
VLEDGGVQTYLPSFLRILLMTGAMPPVMANTVVILLSCNVIITHACVCEHQRTTSRQSGEEAREGAQTHVTTGEIAVPVTLMASVVPKGPCMRPPLSITWYHAAATSSVHTHTSTVSRLSSTHSKPFPLLSRHQTDKGTGWAVPLARNMGNAP